MTAGHRRPTDPIQQELPLQPPLTEPTGAVGSALREGRQGRRPVTRAGERHDRAPYESDAGWRLDDRTRQVGLRGVAFARAQLQRSRGAGPTDGAGETGEAHRPQGRPGRAA